MYASTVAPLSYRQVALYLLPCVVRPTWPECSFVGSVCSSRALSGLSHHFWCSGPVLLGVQYAVPWMTPVAWVPFALPEPATFVAVTLNACVVLACRPLTFSAWLHGTCADLRAPTVSTHFAPPASSPTLTRTVIDVVLADFVVTFSFGTPTVRDTAWAGGPVPASFV